MSHKEFFVVPITHVDLAWKRGRAEMSEMLEIVVVRLLDALEHFPDFKYLIEQAAHYRALAARRPDLIARLQPFIDARRVEVVGGMASTLENNLPNGECFLRNQQMGMEWVRETWGVEIETGWLIDTFGIHAQVPQLMRGFGIGQLMANRFGGSHTHDLFRARGLDGSEITVAGWGTYAAYMHPAHLSERFCKNWEDIDLCFAKADALTGPGPFLVIPYTENEMLVSLYPRTLTEQRKRERPDEQWQNAVPADFFAALKKTGKPLPVVAGDLNPEFTGCFSLRHAIRLRNRTVENRLLEAEKWTALAQIADRADIADALRDAWWEIAFVQFHDVFTGSHPTEVYADVMRILGETEAVADAALAAAFAVFAPSSGTPDAPGSPSPPRQSALFFNGLPFARHDLATFRLPDRWRGVARIGKPDGTQLPFDVREGRVRVLCDTSPVGFQSVALEEGPKTPSSWEPVETAILENDAVRVEFDRVSGLAKLIEKTTGTTLIENAGSWLVAQRDDGNFQIENPAGPEIPAASGTMRLERMDSPLGQTVRLSGEFPPLAWAGSDSHLRYQAEWFLPATRAELRLTLHLDWRGEGTRIRLTLPTLIDSSTGLFEIPFGVVSRKPYTPRTNAKGEWPAHRFVALQDGNNGIALVNRGVGGVEVMGGTIYTTLLRAPKGEYAGMVSDSSSSQHGTHTFEFALVPYALSWDAAGVAHFAQEFNNPILCHFPSQNGMEASLPEADTYFRLEPADRVVLSAVKAASDGSGDLIVRVYETTGHPADALLTLPSGIDSVFASDLRETKGASAAAINGVLHFTLQPFEIRTFRMVRNKNA